MKMRSLFKALFKSSPKNMWARFFYGWRTRPERDDRWYELTKANVPEEALLEMTPEQYMEQEYPESWEEALAPSRVLAAFNRERLKIMSGEIRKPMPPVEGQSALANIYIPFSVGKRYVAFTDTSHGVMGDDSVTTIMDYRTRAVVADIISNLLGPEDLAYESVKLLDMYPRTMWAIEDNDWGILTIARANDLGYKYLYRDPDHEDWRPGTWHTDQGSRMILWGEIIQAVTDAGIVIYSAEGLAQFYGVIRNPNKGGRIEATEGDKDDYPFAVGGCIQVLKNMPIGNGSGTRRPRMW